MNLRSLTRPDHHHAPTPLVIRLSSRPLRPLLAAAGALLALGCATTAAAEPIDHWTRITLTGSAFKDANDMIFANGEFWAVGFFGRLQHSPNGKPWTVVQTPTAHDLTSIAHGNGRYVVTAGAKTILSSPDGTNWTIHLQGVPADGDFRRVIFANGKFLAIGESRDVRISTDGIDWTPAMMGDDPVFNPLDVAWSGGLFVAVGGGSSIMTSPDGVAWTKRNVGFSASLYSVCHANGLFVAGGMSAFATSPDGITWMPVPGPFTLQYATMWTTEFLNGRFISAGAGGTLMSSPDGASWTKHTTSTNADLTTFAYNGDRLVAFRFALGNATASGPWESDPWAAVPSGPGAPGEPAGTRIDNLSTRGWVGIDATQLIAGFVIQGTNPKKVLIRAVGPTLGSYGVAGALADPQLKLFDSASNEIGSNNDWGTNANLADIDATSAAVFAFPLPATSKDAVLLTTLTPGNYTLHISGVNHGTGVALVEVYDCDTPGACRLVNISSRGFVGSGDNVSIPGFIVSGNESKKLLIRGVGPTLTNYDVPGVVADPKIALHDAVQAKIAENDNWSAAADQAGLAAATAQVFAFPLNAGSLDAAMVVTVPPGLYTVVVSGNHGATGVGLVEVYEIP